ncbi:hypothetical protein EDB83DRAFT_2315605 [Lactarius deliciosus]|nr:hypothetical protein EDB83DRAFT_2315605 [Lactarius deliciosus]
MREHTPLFRYSGHSTERSAEQTVIPSANANELAACVLPLPFTRSESKQPESFVLKINPFRASTRPCWKSRPNPSAPRPMGNCFGKEQYPERKHSYFFRCSYAVNYIHNLNWLEMDTSGRLNAKITDFMKQQRYARRLRRHCDARNVAIVRPRVIGWSRNGSWHDERTSVLLQLPGGLRPSIGTTVHLRWLQKEDKAVIVSNNAAMRRECARANDERPPVPSYNDDDDDWDTSQPGSDHRLPSFPSRNM